MIEHYYSRRTNNERDKTTITQCTKKTITNYAKRRKPSGKKDDKKDKNTIMNWPKRRLRTAQKDDNKRDKKAIRQREGKETIPNGTKRRYRSTQSYDKSPYTHRQIQNATWQHKNATNNLDYTTIADRLRTVSWGNDSHPTGLVKPVFGIPRTITKGTKWR